MSVFHKIEDIHLSYQCVVIVVSASSTFLAPPLDESH